MIGWFFCPYKRDPTVASQPGRYCAMRDFSDQIMVLDGGAWREIEILGDRAIVKVRASAATLQLIAATATFRRIPLSRLDDSFSSLTAGQRAALRAEVLDAGYTQAELDAAIPDLASASLREVLRFMASRKRKPTYDALNDVIVMDGEVVACGSIDRLDSMVVE